MRKFADEAKVQHIVSQRDKRVIGTDDIDLGGHASSMCIGLQRLMKVVLLVGGIRLWQYLPSNCWVAPYSHTGGSVKSHYVGMN